MLRVFALLLLSIPYIRWLPAACRISQTLSGKNMGLSQLLLSLQPHFLLLCLSTALEIHAGPLILCFCTASGPDTFWPLAHNPFLDLAQTLGNHPWTAPSKLSISPHFQLRSLTSLQVSFLRTGAMPFHLSTSPSPRLVLRQCWICQGRHGWKYGSSHTLYAL